MWNKPYTLKEGTAIAVGLSVTGELLQLTIGPLEWGIFVWPANLLVLGVFMALLFVICLLRKRYYFCRFITTVQAAVPAIVLAVLLTIVMGLTRQAAEGRPSSDPIGLTKMLNFWPFILVYMAYHYCWRGCIAPTCHFQVAKTAVLCLPYRPFCRPDLRNFGQCRYATAENVLRVRKAGVARYRRLE